MTSPSHTQTELRERIGLWARIYGVDDRGLNDLEALIHSYVTQAEQEAYMEAYRILLNPDYTEIMRLDLILKLGGQPGIMPSGSSAELKKELKI